MKRELTKLAKQVAEENDLIYAPDDAALAWMNEFSKIIRIGEKERCAQACEELGMHDAAEVIRRLKI